MSRLKAFSILLSLALAACAGSAPNNSVALKIDGMTCEPCAQTLEKKFMKEDTIEAVSVDWEEGTATLIQKQDQRIKDTTIEKIVDWSGYELVSINR
ncbi:MAG: heavy-metal-associated domain-containing protein [Alphaproteobacteria bacterium]|nr:heavy-metal-associated domain-containing protein [Alphaproteobacteria bacterium]